jgi:hypothetical protein
VPARAGQRNGVQRGVGPSIAAAVEPVPIGAARADGDRRSTAEVGEGDLGAPSVWIVAGGVINCAAVSTPTPGSSSRSGAAGNQAGEFGVEFPDLSVQLLVAAFSRRRPRRELAGRSADVVDP